MTRWLHPGELDRQRTADAFDPVSEGARHRLSRELAELIWTQVRADATDPAGRCDLALAKQRFRELAARLAGHSARLAPEVGRATLAGASPAPWSIVRGPRAPGRETLIAAEARSLEIPSVPGRQTLVADDASARPGFDDYRALGLRELLWQLGAGHVLRAELLVAAVAADRSIAGRATGWLERLPGGITPTPNGHALWRAAERRAVTLYRRAADAGLVAPDDPSVAAALERCGGGQPLPDALRGEMELTLRADLRRVRVHTDAVAGDAARAIRARAFTVGEDIFFAPGAFAPGGAAGRELLAHELTHVVQAQHGRVPQAPAGRVHVSEPGDAMEQEAEQVARRVAAPRSAPAGPEDARPGAAPPDASGVAGQAGEQDREQKARRAGAPGAGSDGSCRGAAAKPGALRSLWGALDEPQCIDSSAAATAGASHSASSGPAASVQASRAVLRAADPAVVAAGPLPAPPGGVPVNEIGIVAWDKQPALHLRSSPRTANDNVIASLPFNTHVQVMQRFPGDWLLVATLDGKTGFCAREHVWYAPEHQLPEPNARLHRVAHGDDGHAIHIARRYYGAVADKWGTDLRFYVDVLGAVNHQHIPGAVDGWKTVQFRADTFLWIPSVEFARSLHGTLSSGSRSYELASAVGVEGILERVGELIADFREAIRLSGRYIPAAVARHVEDSVVAILESLLWMAVGAVALLAITTVIGAAIGALAGGAGAAPGAAAGFEVGMALLEWMGLGFLIAWIGGAVARIGAAFGAFFAAVWTARGDNRALDRAARAFAEAIGTLAAVLVEAVVMWAISIGVKAAVGKLKGTALGRAFGETRLGEWLEQRSRNYQAGKSPLPGPREALRRLLEQRRRGERGGEPAKQPAQLADAWSDLASRHNLDDVVTDILRLESVDPAVADRLLTNRMNQFDLGELALDHGADGVRAADTMVEASVQPNVARQALKMARDMGIERQIVDLVNSNRLENLQGLRRFIGEVVIERRLGQLGKYNQLMEAYDRAMRGDRVSIEGRRQTPGDAESGQSDVVDYTQRQAVQMKTVTSESQAAVLRNLQSAIEQLGGDKGEHPPHGFQRIADIRIVGAKNPLRFASRAQILAALRGDLSNLDMLLPDDTSPGLVRITNAVSTFLFTPDELR